MVREPFSDSRACYIEGLLINLQYSLEIYASSRPLKRCNDTLVLDTERTTGTRGEISGYSPTWTLSRGTELILQNAGLCLELVYYSSEMEMLAQWDDAVENRRMTLFTYWEPTQVFQRYKFDGMEYELERVSLPRWSAECDAGWESGTYDCDFNPQQLQKFITGRQSLDSELAHFYTSFTLTNSDQETFLAQFSYGGMSHYEAACDWVLNNEAIWQDWFFQCPFDCYDHGECVNGTCVCLQGFEGEFCDLVISNEFFLCNSSTYFIDNTGTVLVPPLTNPSFIPSSYVCDGIIDCVNWADEPIDCSPSIELGVIIISVIVSITIIAIIVTMIIFVLLRKRGRVRAAGLYFLLQMSFACIWGISTVYLWLGRPSDVKCGIIPWFIAIPSSLMIGSLVAKQYKIYKIFSHQGFGALIITNKTLALITLGITSFDILVLIIWSAMSIPEGGVREMEGDDHYLCVGDNFLAYFLTLLVFKGITLIVAAILAWKCRAVPSAYSEAKHIGVSIMSVRFPLFSFFLRSSIIIIISCSGFAFYNAVFLLVVFIPIIFATGSDQFILNWILTVLAIFLWFFTIHLIVCGYVLWGLFQDRHLSEEEKNKLPEVRSSSFKTGTSGATATTRSG